VLNFCSRFLMRPDLRPANRLYAWRFKLTHPKSLIVNEPWKGRVVLLTVIASLSPVGDPGLSGGY